MWHLCVPAPVNVYEGVHLYDLFCLLLPNLQYISSCGNWFIVHGTAVLFLPSDPVNIFSLVYFPQKETLSSEITDKISLSLPSMLSGASSLFWGFCQGLRLALIFGSWWSFKHTVLISNWQLTGFLQDLLVPCVV